MFYARLFIEAIRSNNSVNDSLLDKRTVLIVDDDADSREILAQIVQMQGYHAYQAENGQQALDWIEAVPPPPGLILLDLDMPVMGGREFLSRLARLPGVIPVVVVITGQDPRIVPGAAAVLRKPISLSQLLGLMQGFMLTPENYNGKGN
jgi:two-component system, OmpR family, response regulator CpxR